MYNNLHSFFDLTHFWELGQKYKNIFVQIFVQMKTSKFAFEINWPLESDDEKFIGNFHLGIGLEQNKESNKLDSYLLPVYQNCQQRAFYQKSL